MEDRREMGDEERNTSYIGNSLIDEFIFIVFVETYACIFR